MGRTAKDSRDIATSVGATAVMVALARAGDGIEKRREARQKWAELTAKRRARGQDTSFNPFDLWFDEEDRPDCAYWFTAHGWTTRTVDAREEASQLGRARRSQDRPFTNSFVTSTKP